MKKDIRRIIELSSRSYLENDAFSDPHLDIKELLADTEGVSVIFWNNSRFIWQTISKRSFRRNIKNI